jgi:hypothetical protein
MVASARLIAILIRPVTIVTAWGVSSTVHFADGHDAFVTMYSGRLGNEVPGEKMT